MPQGHLWTSARDKVGSRSIRSTLMAGAASALALLAGACAAPGSDVHLAPFYTRIATADGGTLLELAGGLYSQHRRDEGDFLQWCTLAPLYGIERERNGDYVAQHPFLLGRTKKNGAETTSYVIPLYLDQQRLGPDGEPRSFFFSLPGLIVQRNGDETHGGWFPFYGRLKDFLTFDEASFFLWPLYVHNERAGRVSQHFLWPFFGWTTGGGESSWHVFPLLGRATWEKRYDRTYFLWPFFHWQKNHLGGGGEEPETAWMFFPFFGHTERGTYDSYTGLWPFFGYARDSRSGFWALDCPFPFVRIQRGPDEVTRTRFWPFYSHLEAEGLDTTSGLWPIFSRRKESNPTFERDSFYAIPFWQSWDKLDKATAETSAWRKLWPLYSYERQGEWRSGALFELDPFTRNDLVPRFLTRFFHVYDWEESPDFRRERSFLGLYRRERGRGEDRRSLAGLWASRSYEEEGRPVRETSLLFGLLRWRVNAEGGFAMLRPAFPGPGWPAPAASASATKSRTHF